METIYQYYVSTYPEDWETGAVFQEYWSAVEAAEGIGGCVTRVEFASPHGAFLPNSEKLVADLSDAEMDDPNATIF